MQLLNDYIYVPADDFDKSAEWYADKLGFTEHFRGKLYRELRSPSGIRLLLIERLSGENSHLNYDGMAQPAYGFCVEDIKAVREELTAKGVAVTEIMGYAGLSCKFTDPSGNQIELWQELVD